MLEIGLFTIFVSAFIFFMWVLPELLVSASQATKNRTTKFLVKYEAVLSDEEMKKTYRELFFFPVAFGAAGYIFGPAGMQVPAMVIAFAIGLWVPKFMLNVRLSQRKRKFDDQLTDSLMIMSSSFRGGLSLIQAIESVVDEMPEPTKQEFGIVLGENKMGVSLDESLQRLFKRMPSPSMQQMITAILLARETGGNLAMIFSRIIATKRERKKIEQNLMTLTIQGKIQAVVMSGLPIMFFFAVSASNPRFFDVFKNSQLGHVMLGVSVFLWIIGTLWIIRISKFDDK